MAGQQDVDMTGEDPMSSTAEGDANPGTAALAEAGSGGADDVSGGVGSDDAEAAETPPTSGPPPEAFDDAAVTDAVPEENLGFPEV